jgi:hypothetical protein
VDITVVASVQQKIRLPHPRSCGLILSLPSKKIFPFGIFGGSNRSYGMEAVLADNEGAR